jgi:rhodanese-related sulfurtransferase
MAQHISRDELKQLLDDSADVTVVEALGPVYYEDAHIPGAINIPHEEVDALAPGLLPDKDALIVTYCASAPCRNSDIAARRLEALGYSNVREYVEGKQDWVDAGLPVERGAAAPVG